MNKNNYILLVIAILAILVLIYFTNNCTKSKEGLVTGCKYYIKQPSDMGGPNSGLTTPLDLPTCPLPTTEIDCKNSDVYLSAKNHYDMKTNNVMTSFIDGKKVNATTCDIAFNYALKTTPTINAGTDTRRFYFTTPEKSYPVGFCENPDLNGGTPLQKCQNWCKGCGVIPGSSAGELGPAVIAAWNSPAPNNCELLLQVGNCNPRV